MKHVFLNVYLVLVLLYFLIGTSVSAYSFKNAFDEIGPGDKGLESGYQMADFLGKLFLNSELDKEAGAFFTFWQKSIKDFDLLDLYQAPYLSGRENGFHLVTFQGQMLPDKYLIQLNTITKFDQAPLSHLGNFGAEFGLKRATLAPIKERSFKVKLTGCMAFKQFTHRAIAGWNSGMYKIIDPDNIDVLDAHPAKIFSAITGRSRKPIDDYFAAVPEQAQFFDAFVNLESFIALKEHKNQTYTEVNLKMSPRMSEIKNEFRSLYNYLKNLEGVLWISAEIRTDDGLKIMTFEVDSQNYMFNWKFMTHKGRLIPFNNAGEPDFSRELSLNEIHTYDFDSVFNSKMNFYGLRVNIGNVVMAGKYKRKSEGADFTFKFVEIPPPKIHGRALGILPLFLLDAFIPSNIDELARRFVTVMEKGNDGKGTGLHVHWDERTSLDTKVYMRGNTEILDNHFVNIVMKLWGKRFQPDPEAIRDIARFWGMFFKKLLPGHATPT